MASGIEFTASPGTSFASWNLKNPINYALLASGGGISEPTPGRYRFATSQTGVVWVEATAGPTMALGFADMDNPEISGYSEVTDERPSRRTMLNQLSTTLAGSQPRVISAYDPRKRRLSWVQADDYNFTSGTHIDMQINLPSGVPSNACTVAFAAVNQDDSSKRIDLTLTLVSVAGVYYIRFQATSVKMNVAAGLYDWQAVITETANARRVTVISGDADLAAAVVP